MGYTFTFGDIERICRSLNMHPAKAGSQVWHGVGPDGLYRRTRIDSHGSGKRLAYGTAKAVARQLLFDTVEDMRRYLDSL